jgi:hypothetical protein
MNEQDRGSTPSKVPVECIYIINYTGIKDISSKYPLAMRIGTGVRLCRKIISTC